MEVLPDSLQVHQTLPMSTGIKGSQFKEVQPLQNIGRQGSITFHIMVDKDHFLDPYCTFVYIESILKDGDGNNLATGAPAADGDINNESKVIPVNGLSHAWFNNIIFKINVTVIKSINNKYVSQNLTFLYLIGLLYWSSRQMCQAPCPNVCGKHPVGTHHPWLQSCVLCLRMVTSS